MSIFVNQNQFKELKDYLINKYTLSTDNYQKDAKAMNDFRASFQVGYCSKKWIPKNDSVTFFWDEEDNNKDTILSQKKADESENLIKGQAYLKHQGKVKANKKQETKCFCSGNEVHWMQSALIWHRKRKDTS